MAIELMGGPLYQWDTGRAVRVGTAGASEVHFATAGSSRALVVALADGRAEIPNSLLASGRGIAAWASDGDGTLDHAAFHVRPRAKPDDYIYRPDEVQTWSDIEDWVRKALEDAGEPGTKWYTGDGEPAIGGRVGDLYLDEKTGIYYRYGEKGQ